MIKNIVLLLVGLIILQSCHVSKLSQFKGKYAEFMDAGEQEISTEYHTLLSKKPDGSFIFRQFFPETRQITQKISLSADKKTKNGIYQEWFDDGTLILQGYYKDDMRVGQWNVKDKGIGMYKNGAMEGEWQNKSDEGKLLSAYLYVNGTILQANGKDLFEFTFNGNGSNDMIVKVTLEKDGNGSLVTLHQYNIPVTDEGKSYWHLGCKTGWNFYLTNLKAVLEHGVDLRNKDVSLKGVLNC